MVRIILIIMLSTAWHALAAQPMQAMLWKVSDHYFDFRTDPPTIGIIRSEEGTWGGNWYVDSNGDVILNSTLEGLVHRSGKLITESKFHCLYIPDLLDERYVYCLDESCELIRVDTKECVITDSFETEALPYNTIAVHSSDCSKIWLISNSYIDKLIIYSIAQGSFKKEKVIEGNPDDYKVTTSCMSEGVWHLNLSADCKNYTFTYQDSQWTYFGNFDRSDASFERTAKHFFADYDYVVNSIISPDKSRIYYIFYTKSISNWPLPKTPSKFTFAEVKIKDGLPDYSTFRVFHKIENVYGHCGLFYGPDGKTYFMYYHQGYYGTITIENDRATYKDFAKFATNLAYTYYPIASWFLDNPCATGPTLPCPEMESPVIRWGSVIKK